MRIYIAWRDLRLQAEILYCKAKGDYRKALALTETCDSLQHATLVEGQKAKVVNANAFYKNKELQAKNIALQVAQTKSRIFMIGFVLLLLILVLLGITYTIRRHNKQLKAERDNTEIQRRIAEVERNKAVKLSEMKTIFLHNISHEMRTPLNSIIGFNDLLNNSEKSFSPAKKKEMLEQIHGHSTQLLRLLDHVTILSRIDANDAEPTHEKIDLGEIIGAISNNVVVNNGVEYDAEQAIASKVKIINDSEFATIAISEVIDNAAKFTKRGSITVLCTYDDNGGAKID